MSEPPDRLEAELAALRPSEPSPALRRRIAQRLAEAPPTAGRRYWWLALGSLAAACLVVVLLWWLGRNGGPKNVVSSGPTSRSADAEPTVWAYERALARSPEDLDALLAKQARRAEEPNPELARIGPSTRSDAALHKLLGEE